MWTVTYVSDVAEAEVEALPQDTRASFIRIVDMIVASGLERMREPYVKHIEAKIWEMRLKGRDGIARSLYVTATGRRVVVLRTFVKKTEKTPQREIEIALRRAKEVK
ncbi:MAG: type II toxin-antitoxin system RelE/ParE family toxin [Novosphingobium sp.]